MDKQKAMERLDAIEKEAKALRAEIDKPEAKEPKWKAHPELLVGKLCRVGISNVTTTEKMVKRYENGKFVCGSIEFPIYFGPKNGWESETFWDFAEPLTPAEIQAMTYRESRYDWSKAPDWAMWAGTDRNGKSYWYIKEPHINSSDSEWWLSSDSREWQEFACGPCPDWRDSLEYRPEGI